VSSGRFGNNSGGVGVGNKQEQGNIHSAGVISSSGFTADDVRVFTETRDMTHGDAWKLTGKVIEFMSLNLQTRLPAYMLLPWMLILMKLIRILWSPNLRDNWFDIIGYADLVIREMDDAKSK